jgi:hypothetical protein
MPIKPTIADRTGRRIEAKLREHAAHMAKFEAAGWSRSEASKLAYEMVKPRPKPVRPPKELPWWEEEV